MSIDTRALVEAAQQGDRDAFGHAFQQYHAYLCGFAWKRTQDRFLTEDLVQETALRAWRRIDSFTWQGRDFGAWLTVILRNLITDHYKSIRVRMEVSTAEMVDLDRNQLSPEDVALDRLITDERNLAVRRAMSALTEHQRQALLLQYWGDMTGDEVAARLGIRIGAVKTLGWRARQSLGQVLARQGVPA
ncbi:RNA polymerase sigma factor [Peterkaempfera griseoplana]|uniref:RNA polymerase sigma factor n=1 Tax=Peterkaempfera griseoplana TaxID=66896 RepID=UPI0006E17204|nr:sigma-70 family RNA polymerase sigma factor [Peterkaempfera griseoplana]